MITIEGIRATGLYLLEVLKSEKVVRYSRFYNDTPGSDKNLAAVVMPFVVDHESCGAEDLSEEGHVMLEFAVWQLEDLGVVQVSLLDETLIDGERDYRIELTEKGRHVLAEGLRFHFRGPEYWITATPASEWLITLLEAGGQGQELTLRDVIDYGHSDGNVAIDDDCGNTYGLGTRTYAWAFEVSLWHHARAGHIEPAFETAEQEKLWSDFVGKTGRPSPPDINASQPLWDIPFRLADAVYAGKMQLVHVGNVGG